MKDNWKDLFRSHILERGLRYYEEGAVTEVTETETGYEAVVEGSETYSVEIEIRDERIYDMWCSCPYAEDGNYCKHMAAVLYEIAQEERVQETASPSSLSSGLLPKICSDRELSKTIQTIPEDEIRSLLLELAQRDASLQTRILTQYSEHISRDQITRFKEEIDRIADRNSDRYGFVDWNRSYGYVRDMEDFLDQNVPTLIDRNYFWAAFELTNAVFVKVGNQDMDDSGGESAQLADLCYDYWSMITESCSQTDKRKIFAWFEKHLSSHIVADYMEHYISDFLMNEFHEEDFLKRKLAILDEQIRSSRSEKNGAQNWMTHYHYEYCVSKKLEIMRELHTQDEKIQEYIKNNWEFRSVRTIQLQDYLSRNKFAEAIELLKESKEIDHASPGWVAQYSAQLIELYQKTDRKREYKTELLFQIFHCSQNRLDFVEQLKAVCTQSEWDAYREQILTGSTTRSIRYELMEHEGLYERLLEELAAASSICHLDQYESVLKKKFPEKVRDLYIQYLKQQAEHASDRKRYRCMMQYLKKIQKYPDGTKAASALAGEWRGRYCRRSAMMDELKKAGF